MQYIGEFCAAAAAAAVEEEIVTCGCELMNMGKGRGKLYSAECAALRLFLGGSGSRSMGLRFSLEGTFRALQLVTVAAIGDADCKGMGDISLVIADIAGAVAISVKCVRGNFSFYLAKLADMPMRPAV